MHSLGGVQLALFAHKGRMLHRLDYVSVADVACGVGNVFHNKGAIGAFVKTRASSGNANDEKRMLFVSSHLAAHASKVDDRNADFWRIVGELEAQVPPRFLLGGKKMSTRANASNGHQKQSLLLEAMDYVFWGGDLNYRLDLPREYAEHKILKILKHDETEKHSISSLYRDLLRHDQLLKTISSGKAFYNFAEGPIDFPPTFKYDKGANVYDSSHKKRVPSWTDRILFKCDCDSPSSSEGGKGGVHVMEYGCVQEATQSDHRPVCAKFSVRLSSSSSSSAVQ